MAVALLLLNTYMQRFVVLLWKILNVMKKGDHMGIFNHIGNENSVGHPRFVNKDALWISVSVEGITISYGYTNTGLLNKVTKDGVAVAEYEYNKRGEIISLKQGNVETRTAYNDNGEIVRKLSLKDNKTIFDATY